MGCFFMNVILVGACGKMGEFIKNALIDKYELILVDKKINEGIGYKSIDDVKLNEKDIVIDFTSYDSKFYIIKYALKNKAIVISGTTGYSEKEKKYLLKYARKFDTILVMSSNFSIGTNLFLKAVKCLNKEMEAYQIIETHHKEKKDIPSGTALVISKLLNKEKEDILSYRIDKHKPSHLVVFKNDFEKIYISHIILDRKAYLEGFMKIFDKLVKESKK